MRAGFFSALLLCVTALRADDVSTWRKLAYLHGLTPDAAGVCRAELNLSRGDVDTIAPLKLTWPAAPGCAYEAVFNGRKYPVAEAGGVCSFLVPKGGFRRDRNQVALAVACGADAALTNADRVAVFGTVEAAPGPRLSRRDFFLRRLDRRIPAFAAAADLYGRGDEPGAVRAFAAYVRAHLDIPRETKARYREPPAAERGRIRSMADRVLGGTMDECGVLHTFRDGQIDWQFNPTWNGYREWVWHLSSLHFLDELVRQYALDGNEVYARAWVRYFDGFIRAERCPVEARGNYTSSWRSLETAGRLHAYLVNDVYFLLQSPALTDDFLVTVFQSLWEHGDRLRRGHCTWGGNWFSNEMTALYGFTLLVPYFAESDAWRAYALEKVTRELDEQVYPDGQQVELSTGYQTGVIAIFSRVPRMCAHAGVKPPAATRDVLARMYEPYMAIVRPDGKIPALNDADIWASRKFFQQGLKDFPDRREFAWFAGEKGTRPPDWTSVALPYSGWVTLRTGWDAQAVWCFLDAGPYGTGHQHEDKLNVLLFAYGHEMVNEGGWYDYDTSENRRYVLSTRSHNTVRFDGQDQNRAAGYRWNGATDSKKKADFRFAAGHAVDWGEAVYDEGYGPQKTCGLAHRRRVSLVKGLAGVPPFVVVDDRFTSADDKTHAYEQIWHLRDGKLETLDATAFCARYDAHVTLSAVTSDAAARFVDKAGQTAPELQGWDPGSWEKHNAKPIATPVLCGSFRTAHRVVTVLQPLKDAPDASRITAVEVAGDNVAFRLADGSQRTLPR